jgi:CTP synthase
VNILRIDAEELEQRNGTAILRKLDGILVPGGFGDRGTEGKIAAARYAREKKVPYYGLCLGLQIAVIEYARNVLKLAGANSTEFDPQPADPVINMMEEQKKIIDKGATMRLGSYECALAPGTLARKAYGTDSVRERHRHRYEVNNAYVGALQRAGLVVSGINPRRNLVEIVEVKDHPWFLAVQFHPEFQSKPNRPHPLFAAFVAAAVKRKQRGASAAKPAKARAKPRRRRQSA